MCACMFITVEIIGIYESLRRVGTLTSVCHKQLRLYFANIALPCTLTILPFKKCLSTRKVAL